MAGVRMYGGGGGVFEALDGWCEDVWGEEGGV